MIVPHGFLTRWPRARCATVLGIAWMAADAGCLRSRARTPTRPSRLPRPRRRRRWWSPMSCRRRCRSTASSWRRPMPGRRWRSVPGCRPSSKRSTSPRAPSSRRTSCCSRWTSASTRRSCSRRRPSSRVALARLGKAETDERRLKPLAERKAVPQQDYDNAAANLLAAQASVSAARADVVAAELDLSYTTIRSPITGLIGKRLVAPGNLVGKSEATLARHRVEHRSDPRQRHHQRSRVPALLRAQEGPGPRLQARSN